MVLVEQFLSFALAHAERCYVMERSMLTMGGRPGYLDSKALSLQSRGRGASSNLRTIPCDSDRSGAGKPVRKRSSEGLIHERRGTDRQQYVLP